MVGLFRWILSFLPDVLTFATNVFDVMTSPMVEVFQTDIVWLDWTITLLSPVLAIFGELSILQFMCGGGLVVFIVVGIIKYFSKD